MRVLLALALGAAIVAAGCTGSCSGLLLMFEAPGFDEALAAAVARGSLPADPASMPRLDFDPVSAGVPPEWQGVRLVALVWMPPGEAGLQVELHTYDGPAHVSVGSAADVSDEEVAERFLAFARALSIEEPEPLLPLLLDSREPSVVPGDGEYFDIPLPRAYDATTLHAELGPAQPIVKEDPGAFHAETLGEWTFRFDVSKPDRVTLETELGNVTLSVWRSSIVEAMFHDAELREEDAERAKAALRAAFEDVGLPIPLDTMGARPVACVG